MISFRKVNLLRAVEVIKIPTGEMQTLAQGTQVDVTQEKGNSATINFSGNLYLLTGANLDAIGLESIEPEILPKGASEAEILAFAWKMLATCYDPEIPINIVDLGLVYQVKLVTMLDSSKHLLVKMTLTSPTCGIGDTIAKDAETKLSQIQDIDRVLVEIVLTPVWTKEMMSDEAKLELGLF